MSLLEAVGEMRGDELRQALHELQAAEFLYEVRLFPDPEYTFKHALTHEVAYGGVLQERRRALHVAIVEAIERLYAGRLAEQVERLADHAVRGPRARQGRTLPAPGGHPGRRALGRARGDPVLRAGAGHPPGTAGAPETLAQALAIHMELGPALMAVAAPGRPRSRPPTCAPATSPSRSATRRAASPRSGGCGSSTTTAAATPLRSPRGASCSPRRRRRATAPCCWRRTTRSGRRCWPEARRGPPFPTWTRSRALPARAARVAGGALRRTRRRACCRYQLALAQMLLGETDRALATLADALRLAAELDHPLTMTITLWFACCIHYQRGDDKAVATHAERLASLTQDYGFTTWADVAIVGALMGRGARLGVDALADVHRRLLASVGEAGGTCSVCARSPSSTPMPVWATEGVGSSTPSSRPTASPSTRLRSTGSRAAPPAPTRAGDRGGGGPLPRRPRPRARARENAPSSYARR